MTKNEFKTIAKTIKLAYPRSNIMPNTEALDLWYSYFADMDIKIMGKVLDNWILNNQMPPSISDLNSEYIKLKNTEVLEEQHKNRFDCIPENERNYLENRGIIDCKTECMNLGDADKGDLRILEKYQLVTNVD